LSLSGYALGELGDDVPIEAQSEPIISLAEVAGEMGVVVGFCEEGRGFQTYNSAAYLEGGVRRRRREVPLVKEARLALLARELNRLAEEGGDL
jgi:hypothetical protein